MRRGSSTPPGHSNCAWASLSGYNTGAPARVKRSPSPLSASPRREVWRPIRISPLASSARYSTYTFPSLTAAAGLKVANSSHRTRSEEHTSELQSPCNLVCRLLLEKKKKINHLRITLHNITSAHL